MLRNLAVSSGKEKRAAARAVTLQSVVLCKRLLLAGALEFVEFVLHFEFLTLQRRDHEGIGLSILLFAKNLAVEFLMASFQRRNVAYSRHKQLL